MRAEYITSHGKYEVLQAEKQRQAVEYRAAERDKAMRRIYAPVRGVVTKTSLEVGEWAKQGDPVIHLVDASTCIIKFAIPLKYAAQLHTGEEFPISLSDDATITNIKGKLTYFSTVADPASGLVEGRITFDNAKLNIKPGIKAVVHIKTATDK
jgi:multidrug resistance efflux pump